MIKKVLVMILVLSLVSTAALAAGKLTIIQERMIPYDSYGYAEARIFAEVENTGDRPVEFSAGIVEIFDADGNTIEATDNVYCYPLVLKPGETGYVFAALYPDTVSALEIVDYSLNIMGMSSTDEVMLLPATGQYELVQDGNWTYHYMTAKITNATDKTVYNPYCLFALKDANAQLLYVDYTGYYTVGIPAGGTIFLRFSVPDGLLAYYEDHGLVPVTVDVVAFQN